MINEMHTEGFRKKENKLICQYHTMKGLTCNDFAATSEVGLKTNETLSPHGVLVTYRFKIQHVNITTTSNI